MQLEELDVSFENSDQKIDKDLVNKLFPEMMQWVLFYVNTENAEVIERIK